MQELRLVAVSADGRAVVLRGPGGHQFSVRIDDQLRAAVRLDRAHLGQLQIQMESTVRPREIQARIRAGETAEEIAAGAGIDVEAVRRFEGPIRAERDYVAAQARAVVPRRSQGNHATLADLVADRLHERLQGRGQDAGSLEWDAWRREDGTWTLRLSFPAGTTQRWATWRYDAGRRTVAPEDEDAVWLTDGEVVAPVVRTLVAVRDDEDAEDPRERVYDVEADGGIERADGQRVLRPSRADEAAGDVQPQPEGDEPGTGGSEPAGTTPARTETAQGARRRAGRRATVPSWDDILLGTRRHP